MKNKELMVVVYTQNGHTYKFYNVTDIDYHNKNLSFSYGGFSGITKAKFHNVAGITKHNGIANPHLKGGK